MLKRILLIVAVVVLVPVLAFVTVMGVTFSGNKELVDGVMVGSARLIKDNYVAMYLLPVAANEVALVDCGGDDKGAPILAELQRRNLQPSAVKAIFLTHGHADHTGACHLFAEAKVYAMAGDVALAAGTARSKGPLPSRMDAKPEATIKVTDVVSDGQVINVGPLSVKAYAVGGHTAGSVSYLINGVLFMGDNATGGSHGQLKLAPWVFSDDQDLNRRELMSLDKRLIAEQAEVKTIAFGHSGPVEGTEALHTLE